MTTLKPVRQFRKRTPNETSKEWWRLVCRLRDYPRWSDPEIGDLLWQKLVALDAERNDATWERARHRFQPNRITFDAQSGTVFWFHQDHRDVSIYRAEVTE